MSRALILGLSCLLAAVLAAWTPAAVDGWNQSSAEATLWQLLNGARTNNGLAPLQQHSGLVGIARWRSADMLERDYFSHSIPGTGCDVYCYYDGNGIAWQWAGENIGWNSGLDDSYSPVRVHEAFMASPGHRANVLDARFTHGGVGAAAADGQMFQGHVQNTRMYTELFLQAPSAPPAVSPPPANPAPRPPASGGSGSRSASAQPQSGQRPKATPAPERRPRAMTVAAPVRPVSTAGLDGVSTAVSRPQTDPIARHELIDALAERRYERAIIRDRQARSDAAATSESMRVESATPQEPSPLESLLNAIVGFLLGG